MIRFRVNGEERTTTDAPDMPLLWFIRDRLGYTGTKFGCGVGACGACTVHVNGAAVRSCVTPIESIDGAEITTIEAVGKDGLTAVQEAWIREQVPQCGYCQSGMIMAALDFLKANPDPSDQDIRDQITNICRCGTYPRIFKAIKEAAIIGATMASPEGGEASNG